LRPEYQKAQRIGPIKATSLYTSLTDPRSALKNLFTFNDLPQPL
jgi:hypothetical protein